MFYLGTKRSQVFVHNLNQTGFRAAGPEFPRSGETSHHQLGLSPRLPGRRAEHARPAGAHPGPAQPGAGRAAAAGERDGGDGWDQLREPRHSEVSAGLSSRRVRRPLVPLGGREGGPGPQTFLRLQQRPGDGLGEGGPGGLAGPPHQQQGLLSRSPGIR